MAGTTDVVVKFVADSTSVQNEVDKVEKTGGKISGWAKGVGGAIAGVFAIKAVKDFIDQASALQDSMAAAGETFGTATGEITKFAEKAAEAFGMSKREATEAAITMGTFGKAAGLTGTDLTSFSTDLVGLAGDLASFRGTTPEEAILALGGALRGENEGIRAYGVLLDENVLKARAMSMGLVAATGDVEKIQAAQISATTAQQTYNKQVEKFGKESPEAALAAQKLELAQLKLQGATEGTIPDLTAQQKILATQAEVFAQTTTAQGDFARTSDSAANQQKKLKADLENTQAAIGTALLPVLQKLLPYLSTMAKFVEENSAVLVPLIAIIGALVVILKIATIVQTAFGISFTAALWPVLLVIAAIAALIAIGVLIVKNWDTIKEAAAVVWQFMQTAWDGILGVVQTAFNWIRDNWPLLLAILTGPIGVAVALIIKHWETIKNAAQAVFDWIKSNWPLLLAVLTGPIGMAVGLIVANWNTIKNAATDLYNWVADKFRALAGVISSVVGGISSAVGSIVNALKAPINAVIRGWNNLEFKVPEVDLGPFGKIGGQSWGPPDITPLASGGIVTRPTLALVGERGPEAVIPLDRAGGAGGTVINVNLSVAAGADPARVGKTLVDYIAAYERANGRMVLAR